MKDLGLLILRLTTGGLLAGHGAQKLFGAFEGPGLEGTAGWLESMDVRPGRQWAIAAGAGEFGSGILMALGFLNPLGPIAVFGPMVMATVKVHWGKPIWVSAGGAELPVTNMAVASAVALAGPGRYSLDHALGIRLPWWVGVLAAGATAAGIYLGLTGQLAPPREVEETAGAELQGGEEAPES